MYFDSLQFYPLEESTSLTRIVIIDDRRVFKLELELKTFFSYILFFDILIFNINRNTRKK